MGIRPDRGGVTEVCSKIFTPLENTGGNNSTGGLQISFLGVYNSTGRN